MLILTEGDVNQSLSMIDAINVMEEAFIKYANKNFIMPERVFSKVTDENTFMLMPCYVDDCIGLKVATTFPTNSGTKEPVTQGVIMINDRKTGKALALINGTLLTAIKTAAVSGVAMRYFKQEATTVGLVGTGLQGLYQVLAATNVTNVKQIYIYNRTQEKIDSFIRTCQKLLDRDVEIITATNQYELIECSDVIITATTSPLPVLPNEVSIYKNKLIIGVGSYMKSMRELPEALFRSAAYYFIDSEDGKKEVGDIAEPLEKGWIEEEKVILLSDIITNKSKYQPLSDDPIIFKTISMSLFDALIGNYVYKIALEQNIGTVVEL